MSELLNGKTTVLFDLDGTLLPMDLEEFTNTYFALIGKKGETLGYDPKKLVDAVWQGTKAMIKNDGTMKNHDRFWKEFSEQLGEGARSLEPCFDEFYEKEFHRAREATRENPLAKRAVEALKKKGLTLVLATNPLFPMTGISSRLSWLDLKKEDFSHITTYEVSSYCKPDPRYFKEILNELSKRPEECLMIGNDAEEDLAAQQAGMQVYLVTDCLVNSRHKDLSRVQKGSFSELLEILEA